MWRARASRPCAFWLSRWRWFSSKRALLSAVAEHLVSGARFDGQRADWREQIRYCFRALRQLCLAHPGLPRLLEAEGAAPAAAFAPLDVALRAFERAGLGELDALRAYFLLVTFTLGRLAGRRR